MQITPNQSWLDIALQETGTLQSLFVIAEANGVSITDRPIPGDDATIPMLVIDKVKLEYLKGNGVMIGTNEVSKPGGIGFWKIEVDFKVS